ncbi:MAG: hypothetical protein D6788_10795, partial [Planctomycetota bacterium]
IYDVLTGETPLLDAAVEAGKGVTVVPADIDLAGAEAELVSVMGREVLLREAIEAMDRSFDYLLIDCPPSLGVLTVNALAAAKEVLIPLQAHFLALQGLSKLLNTVTLVRQRINPELSVKGVVLCMYESTTRLAGEVVEDLSAFLASARSGDTPWSQARLYKTVIRRNIKLAESSSFGQTVFDYAPKSNGAADYARLAAEVFELEPAEAARVSKGEEHEKEATPARSGALEAAPADGNGHADVPASNDVPSSRTDARPAPTIPAGSKSGRNGADRRPESSSRPAPAPSAPPVPSITPAAGSS